VSKPAAAALGIDIGSTTCKAVAIDARGTVILRMLEPTDPLIAPQAARMIQALRAQAGDVTLPLGATGYGRRHVEDARVITEITCHARGAYHHLGRAGVLVDIGGQDTKVIFIGADGTVEDFHMNDKCAAGTGRFLEVILNRLKVPLADVGLKVARAREAVAVSSMCTVFAESEVVSLVAQGVAVEDIVKGLLQSLASRVAGLIGRIPPGAGISMSGGVALNPAMVEALAKKTGMAVTVMPDPQYLGALGAALSVLPGSR